MAENLEERIKDGSLTLCEWEYLEIKKAENYNKLKELLSSKEDIKRYIDVFDHHGYRIIAKQFVGFSGFDEPILVKTDFGEERLKQIIITPKIETTDFIEMFKLAYNIKVPEFQLPPELERIKDIRLIFAIIYISIVEELLKKLRKYFVVIIDNLNSKIKGKLLLDRYIRESVARCKPQIAVCQFYELTPDNLINRVIKVGLRISKSILSTSEHTFIMGWLSRVTRCIAMMSGVKDVGISQVDLARIRIHSQNRHYEPALIIAKVLINCCHLYYKAGIYSVKGFFFDMNDLFERFVAGLLKLCLINYSVKYKEDKGKYYYYKDENDKRSVNLIPDITLDNEDIKIIIDAKYKELFKEEIKDDFIDTDMCYDEKDSVKNTKVKIRYSDIYQMVAYLDNMKCAEGILFYPCVGNGFSNPIIVDGFGDKKIKLIGIGLTDIKQLKYNKNDLQKYVLN